MIHDKYGCSSAIITTKDVCYIQTMNVEHIFNMPCPYRQREVGDIVELPVPYLTACECPHSKRSKIINYIDFPETQEGVRVSLCMRMRPRPSTVQPTTSECICTGLKEAGRHKNQLRSEELRSTESRGRVSCPYLINESVATEVTSPTPLLRRRECSHSVSHSIAVFLANAAKPHQPIEC